LRFLQGAVYHLKSGEKYEKVLHISCQKCNPELINSDYIYRITLHQSQKGKSSEMNLPLIEKTISHDFYGHDICIFIAVSWNQGYVHRRWR